MLGLVVYMIMPLAHRRLRAWYALKCRRNSRMKVIKTLLLILILIAAALAARSAHAGVV